MEHLHRSQTHLPTSNNLCMIIQQTGGKAGFLEGGKKFALICDKVNSLENMVGQSSADCILPLLGRIDI